MAKQPPPDRARVAGEIGRVLHEALRQLADGRGAQPDQRVGVVGGVALEIAAQPLLARGHGERVVGQREMVEADRLIAEAAKRLGGDLRLLQPFAQVRQGGLVDQPLVRS